MTDVESPFEELGHRFEIVRSCDLGEYPPSVMVAPSCDRPMGTQRFGNSRTTPSRISMSSAGSLNSGTLLKATNRPSSDSIRREWLPSQAVGTLLAAVVFWPEARSRTWKVPSSAL